MLALRLSGRKVTGGIMHEPVCVGGEGLVAMQSDSCEAKKWGWTDGGSKADEVWRPCSQEPAD